MRKGIAKNAYNHHKGDPSTRPPCLCWRPDGWKLNQCADCKQPLSEERFQKEQELKEIAMKEDAAATAATTTTSGVSNHAQRIHSLGIRVEALIAFASAHDCMEWPTWRVVRDIIVPATRNRGRCRFGDLPELKECFGPATVFMSHCWGALFGDLVGAACHGARKDRIVWIDIFAVRQWPGNVADLDFRGVIQLCDAMIVSCSPVSGLRDFMGNPKDRDAFLASAEGTEAKTILPTFRLWCVVELAAACLLNVPIVVKCGRMMKKKYGHTRHECIILPVAHKTF